jgi:predicted nuclease of predicted toxin-antitoxin system
VKLLLDTCVWGGAVEPLQRAGHEVDWSGNWEVDPGDEEILARAFAESRILVTLDKDFGELAIVRGLPHSGILRVAGFASRQQAHIIDYVLSKHGLELNAGAVITAEPGRLRIRPPGGSEQQDETPA